MNQAVIASPTIGNVAAAALKLVGWPWFADVRVARRAGEMEEVATLEKNQTSWMKGVVGHEIHCESGTLWLTIDGKPQDIILEAGESHLCVSRSRMGVHALSAAKVRVESRNPEADFGGPGI
jgi:hypothetical protein